MLDTFIRKGGTKAQRRVRAAVSLFFFFPVLLPASVVIGTIYHLYDFLSEFLKDLKALIVSDIPRIVSEMTHTVKTGEAK